MAEIRKASMEDVDAVAQLFDDYRVFYKYPSDIDSARKFLTERISNNDSEIFICFNDVNTAVGFVHLYPLFSSTRMKKLWLLNDLYVHEQYRGKANSIALIEKAKELCKSTNACGLMLETAKDNMVGNNLYPKTGFQLDNDHNYYSWDDNVIDNNDPI